MLLRRDRLRVGAGLLALALALATGPVLRADPAGLQGSERFRGPCGWLNTRLDEWAVPRSMDSYSPVHWYRRARFGDACTGLRRCYGLLGSSREACEDQLLKDLEGECGEAYGGFGDGVARDRCLLAARLLHRAVAARGLPLWRDAQYEALHLDTDELWPTVRRSQKWRIGYPAPGVRVPTRSQAAAP